MKIKLNKAELDKIVQIVRENGIEYFELSQPGDFSGLGRLLDLHWPTEIGGRPATVQFVVSDHRDW